MLNYAHIFYSFLWNSACQNNVSAIVLENVLIWGANLLVSVTLLTQEMLETTAV